MATLSQLCLIMAPLDSETDSDLEEFPPTDPEEIRGHGLPWDILLYLMKFLDMRELSYLMRTCRTLYEHGIQILLTAHAPRLVFMAEYLSFCRFMLRCTRRPSLLRGLHLVDPLPSSRFATDDAHTIMTALADVISQAVNLENLEVDGMYTKLNDPDTGYLWPAITSLERLRIVNLSNVYPRILHSLESMRSSVQELTIEMDHPDYPMAYDETPLLQYLKPFAGSLRKLRLCSLIQTLQEVDITPLESVHTLMVDPVFTRRINLDTLVFTFPNVQSLKIDTGFIEEDEDENWDLDVARFYQEESLSMRWPCLENLVCPVEWAYTSVLGKVTYWKRVHVGGNICKDVGDHVEQFKTVLSDIRPAYLDLMLDLCDPDILDAYLFPELDSITHLNLDLLKLQEAFIRGEEFWLELLISGIIADIKVLTGLVFLSIRFEFDDPPNTNNTLAINESLKHLEIWRDIYALAKSIPTLTHFSIQFGRHQQDDVCWYFTRDVIVEDGYDVATVDAVELHRKDAVAVLRSSPFAGTLSSYVHTFDD